MYRRIPPWKQYLPNAISLFRLFWGALGVTVLFQSGYVPASFIAFVFFVYTDKLDGQLARKWNVMSDFGKIIDPAADKAFIVPLFFTLGIPKIFLGQIILLCLLEGSLALVGLWVYVNRKRIHGYAGASVWGKRKLVCEAVLLGLFFLDKFGFLYFLGEFGKINLFIVMFWAAIFLAFFSGIGYIRKIAQK